MRIEDFMSNVQLKNNNVFVPIESITEVGNRDICDITVESKQPLFYSRRQLFSS